MQTGQPGSPARIAECAVTRLGLLWVRYKLDFISISPFHPHNALIRQVGYIFYREGNWGTVKARSRLGKNNALSLKWALGPFLLSLLPNLQTLPEKYCEYSFFKQQRKTCLRYFLVWLPSFFGDQRWLSAAIYKMRMLKALWPWPVGPGQCSIQCRTYRTYCNKQTKPWEIQTKGVTGFC